MPALAELQAREELRFAERHPRSRELFERARESLFEGVPMHWMRKWPGGFPVFVREAKGARFVTWTESSMSTSASATQAR